MAGTRRVLSIQSHVCHGVVGNKSATFPLQVLGVEVDGVNSVQFSNHTGYPTFTGEVLDGQQLLTLVDGLVANGLVDYTHVLTGYIGSTTFLRAVVTVIKRIRAMNPDVVYVCDPVLGDDGRLYVSPELVPIYRDEVLPLASILTPNQFEAEVLSNVSIVSQQTAVQAIDVLHSRGVRDVVITSMRVHADTELIHVLGSRNVRTSGNGGRYIRGAGSELFVCEIPHLPQRFTGTGDLFSALTLAWSTRAETKNLRETIIKALSTLQAVVKRTHKYAKEMQIQEKTDNADTKKARVCRHGELRLIQSLADIISPPEATFATFTLQEN